MNIDLHDAAKLNRQVLGAMKRRFRQRFALFFLADLIILSISVFTLLIQPVLGVFLVIAMLPRTVAAPFVLAWSGNVFRLYTNIQFHRENLLRRGAAISYSSPMSTWFWLSVLAGASLGFIAVVVGFIVLLLAFSTNVLEGINAVLVEVLLIVISLYLYYSEKKAYLWCVIAVVDSVLSDPTMRRSFLLASTALYHNSIDNRLQKKTDLVIRSQEKNRNVSN